MASSVFSDLAVDLSSLQTVETYKCILRSGYKRVVIRGYIEAYGRNPGGAIDRNFVQNYKNARAAGFTYIDVYMFPCTGRPTCKTPQQQVQELVRLINTNKIIVATAWLDLEVDPNANNWSMGAVKNREVLRQFYRAWQSTGWKWGIYTVREIFYFIHVYFLCSKRLVNTFNCKSRVDTNGVELLEITIGFWILALNCGMPIGIIAQF